MVNSVEVGGLKVNEELHALVQDEIAPGTGVDAESFWISLNSIVKDLAPKNRQLLDKRNHLQQQIDAWCVARCGGPFNVEEYAAFLTEISYLEPECGGLNIPRTTQEIAPNLVLKNSSGFGGANVAIVLKRVA